MPHSTKSQSLDNLSQWIDDPIAIVGIGLRLPGSIRTPQQYWDLLTNKRSGRCRVPSARYNVDAFLGPKGKQGHVCTEYGYFLDDDLAAVDSSFWSTPPEELELLDPQQRLMLEVVYECLESSGTATYQDKDIGLYVGVLGEDWMDIQTRDPLEPGSQFVTGYGDFAISNRLSKKLGLTGPSMTIRTACSSSLMALHTACQALYMGECSSAVVGGCNLILTPRMTATMSELGVLSPNGRCRSFDAKADGYARGEAVNAIQIKRLSHALRDGDPIRSVIRSVCINSDGHRSPLYIPSTLSHELLIRRSHQLAGIDDISQTAMIECHGTGTVVGDMQEGRAVAKVFGELGGVLIGSVKPNIGHSEGASGLSSIIKMVLALENQTIPPNIDFTAPNPKIPFKAARLRVPVDCEPWPRNKAERVGLNGFGIGGANGHVLLESARSLIGTKTNGVVHEDLPQLLAFSGIHPETVNRGIDEIIRYLKQSPHKATDASYTLGCRRRMHPNRAFAIGSGDSWDISPIEKAGPSPDLVWVFSGQGSQYAGMGQELITFNAIARNTIQLLDVFLYNIDPGRSWTIREELLRPESLSRLHQAKYAQPCCTAIQIALVDVLRSLNLQPAAVIGHSAGEIAAAYAAGALTAAEAITVSYHRGQVASKVSGGGMMAISLGREQIPPFLSENVSIACENSSRSTTLSGDLKELDALAETLRHCYPDVSVKRLPVSCAYHSEQMKQVEEDYLKRLAGLPLCGKKLSCPFVSSVTGRPIDEPAEIGAEYWCRNLTSPVLFLSAVINVKKTLSNPLFVEVGSHSVLLGPLRDIEPSVPYIPTLVRGSDAYTSILRTAGRLFQYTDIELSSLCRGKTLGSLPPYQWHHDYQFWSESRVSRNWRFRQHAHHELLGSKIPDGNDMEPLWRCLVNIESIPWLRDYVVNGKVALPRACYIVMAGEAVRQLTGHEDFSLRHVNFLEEQTLHKRRYVELLTQLRTSQGERWYEFTITSHYEGNWTKLCTGQARGGQHGTFDNTKLRAGPRKVKKELFYRVIARAGREYGGRFRALDNLAAGVSGFEATAQVLDVREKHESIYALHPGTIGSTFQLLSVALNQGRYFDRVAVPSYIEEAYVAHSSDSIAAQSSIASSEEGTTSSIAGFVGNTLVLAMRNIEICISKLDDTRGPDPHAGARLQWKPDIDEVDISALIRPTGDISPWLRTVEELILLCIMEATQSTPNAESQTHYAKYHQWLNLQRELAERGEYPNVPSCQEIVSMSSEHRKSRIESLYKEVDHTPAAAVMRIYQATPLLFNGQTQSLNLLVKDDLLNAIYGFKLCDYSDFFRVFAHSRPCMRVLEIGAGTGGATSTILPALHGPNGEQLYDIYTFTDISTGFFDDAKESFAAYDGIVYRPLDITGDIAAQGFDATYDLVIASNVLHATPDLQTTLANVKSLLKPDGKLFLQELAPSTKWINYVMGTLPGWWLSTDNRLWEPYISPERWDRELRAAGLSGNDAVVHDGQMNAHIISSLPKILRETTKSVTILSENDSLHSNMFIAEFQRRGYATNLRTVGDELPTGQMIISLLELDRPLLDSLDEVRYLKVRNLITSIGDTPMLWVTRSSQVNCSDPRYASTLGLLRTARRELGLTVATLELDTVERRAVHAATVVADRVLSLGPDSPFDPVLEYAFNEGTLMVGRFHPAVMNEELLDHGPLGVADTNGQFSAATIEMRTPGKLDTLHWKREPVIRPESVDDWVELQVCAIGISPDTTFVSGNVNGYAGTIQRVGPGVKDLRVGDRVMVLPSGSGTFASRFIASEKVCVQMPPDLSYANGATMPYVFATALCALIDVAKVKRGDAVLISDASSGVGAAAVQVCRILGAEAYCLTHSGDGMNLQVERGEPKYRITKLDEGTFVSGLFAATQGRGVDVLLNTSASHTNNLLQCVAELGIVVDLAGQDLKARLPTETQKGNCVFAAVDLPQIGENRPGIIQRLLKLLMHHYALGELTPFAPVQYPAEEIKDAFQYLRTSEDSQVAVIMPEDISGLPVTLCQKTPFFRSDAMHLIVGGLGGLGRSISSWMACHGARYFVLFSPNAAKKGDDEFVEELRAQGCRIDLISGDVSNETDVDILVKCFDEHIPVAGVMQASMALEVTSLSDMSFKQWNKSFAPKVQGTWNLHNALLKYGRSTDYFLLFSSLSGLIGQTGHANYAAGNAFLDAFVQYRHSLGLPCSSIDIGVMQDVGYVSGQQHVLDHFAATSTYSLHERDLHDAVHLAIENSALPLGNSNADAWPSYVSQGQICVGLRSTSPLDVPDNRVSWRRDPRMALYHNINKTDTKNPSKSTTTEDGKIIEDFLAQAKLKPEILAEQSSADLLVQEIGKALFNFMMRDLSDLNLDIPLTSLGIDSLLAIKVRRWFEQVFGIDVPVVQILGCGGLRELGGITAKSLLARFKGESEAGGKPSGTQKVLSGTGTDR